MKKKTQKTKPPKIIRPDKNFSDLRKLLNAYRCFLDSFETVFYRDDDMTYSSIAQGETFDLDAALSDPEQFTGDNWANRDNLLISYGRLKQLLGERSVL